MTYREYEITYNPGPYSLHDYHFRHVDYDGPEDRRSGYAPTLEACHEAIDDMVFEFGGGHERMPENYNAR